MRLECWGHEINVDEPDIVGECEACGGQIYDYEFSICNCCDSQIHEGCKVECEQCGDKGCKVCYVKDDEDFYVCGEDCSVLMTEDEDEDN